MTMANAETVHVVEGGEDRSVAVLEHAFGLVCPDGLVHGADQACERVDERTIRPVARAGLPAQELRVHRPQDRQAEDGEHRARIAAELVIIGLQVLPFSPAALKPASWVIVVVWIVLGLVLRLMSLRSRRE